MIEFIILTSTILVSTLLYQTLYIEIDCIQCRHANGLGSNILSSVMVGQANCSEGCIAFKSVFAFLQAYLKYVETYKPSVHLTSTTDLP